MTVPAIMQINYFVSIQVSFSIRKKFVRKLGPNRQNLKKITRLNFQNLVFLLATNRYFIIIPFEMLKMELKFKCRISITKV